MKAITAALFFATLLTTAGQAQADLIGDQIEIQISIPNISSFNDTQVTTVTADASDALHFVSSSGTINITVDPGPTGFVLTNTGSIGFNAANGSTFQFRQLDFAPDQVVSGVAFTHSLNLINADTSFTADSASLNITSNSSFSAGSVITVSLTTEDPPAPQYPDLCNGDGGDQMGCTDCPCNNNAAPGTIGGCVNSAGTSSRLIASGDPSISLPSGDTTDLRFQAEGLPATAFGVLVSGDAAAPTNAANPCFGLNSGLLSAQFDGLRCVVQQTQRHGGRAADELGIINAPFGPNRVWGGEAQPTDGIGVQAGFVAGQTRYFQINHRDNPAASCMRGLNTSQAVEVTFAP